MRAYIIVMAFLLVAGAHAADESTCCANGLTEADQTAGFELLFNGKTLDGWKAAEHPSSFTVHDGELVVHGKRGHLFYVGKVNGGVFTNFHLKLQVLTKPGANSGVYFHTQYQDDGWPRHGYEAQVNNSGGDPSRTGGLYAAADNTKSVASDNTWFQYEVIVRGKQVTVKVDGDVITTYTEAEDVDFDGWPGRRLSKGTFAIQAHDPGSEVHYRNIMVRVLD